MISADLYFSIFYPNIRCFSASRPLFLTRITFDAIHFPTFVNLDDLFFLSLRVNITGLSQALHSVSNVNVEYTPCFVRRQW